MSTDHTAGGAVTGAPMAEAGRIREPGTADFGEAVAQIWAAVLGLEHVGLHDSFLSLGGESLLATQVASQIFHQLQVEVSIRSILVGTVAEVAAELARLTGRERPIGPLQP